MADSNRQRVVPYVTTLPPLSRPFYLFLVRCKWFVIAASVIAFIYNHDVPTLVYFVGAFACSGIAKLAKKVIRQPRPSNRKKVDEGMPSSHASTLYYMSIFLTLAILDSNALALADPVHRALLVIALQTLTFLMIAVRYTEQFHSVPQLLAGVILGTAFALLWYLLAGGFINPILQAHLERIQMRWLGFVILR